MTREELEKRVHEFAVEIYKEGFEDGSADVKTRVESAYEKGLEDAWECARKVILSCGEGGYDAGTIADIFGMSYHDVLKECKPNKVIELIKEYEERQKIENFANVSGYSTKEVSEAVDKVKKHLNVQNHIPLCTYTNKEVAESFLEDILAVEELLPKQTDTTDMNDGNIKVGDEIYSDETDMTAVVHYIDAWGRYQCFNSNGALFVLDKETYDEYWHKTYKYYPQIAEVLEQLRVRNDSKNR